MWAYTRSCVMVGANVLRACVRVYTYARIRDCVCACLCIIVFKSVNKFVCNVWHVWLCKQDLPVHPPPPAVKNDAQCKKQSWSTYCLVVSDMAFYALIPISNPSMSVSKYVIGWFFKHLYVSRWFCEYTFWVILTQTANFSVL